MIFNRHASASCAITINKKVTATLYRVHTDTLLAGESIVFNGTVWARPGGEQPPSDIQVFTGNGTWTKPTTFTPNKAKKCNERRFG